MGSWEWGQRTSYTSGEAGGGFSLGSEHSWHGHPPGTSMGVQFYRAENTDLGQYLFLSRPQFTHLYKRGLG